MILGDQQVLLILVLLVWALCSVAPQGVAWLVLLEEQAACPGRDRQSA